MDKLEIIKRIEYFRKKEKISARQLSLQLGNDKSYVSRMESGEFNLTISKLLEILQILNVTPEEFFAKNYDSFNEDLKLEIKFIDLSFNDKQIIKQLIERLKTK